MELIGTAKLTGVCFFVGLRLPSRIEQRGGIDVIELLIFSHTAEQQAAAAHVTEADKFFRNAKPAAINRRQDV